MIKQNLNLIKIVTLMKMEFFGALQTSVALGTFLLCLLAYSALCVKEQYLQISENFLAKVKSSESKFEFQF